MTRSAAFRSIWIGFDPREGTAFAVCRHSLRQLPSRGFILPAGMLSRFSWLQFLCTSMSFKNGVVWDDSGAIMPLRSIMRVSGNHALAKTGWACFGLTGM